METILDFFRNLQNIEELIRWGGFAVMAFIVFAETGLMVGFFLPGDSLLFTAGALVGTGILTAPHPLPQDPFSSIVALALLLILAAVTGNATGYWIGRKAGPHLFSRPKSRFFNRDQLLKTQSFYEKHGAKTIILAQWVPFARTFAPVVAGVAQMPYRIFAAFNVIGAIIWVCAMTMLGFFLGNNPFVRDNNEKVILLIIFVSLLPAILHVLKERRSQRTAAAEETRAARR